MPAHTNRKVFTIPLLLILAVSGIACRKKTLTILPPPTPPPTSAPAAPMEQPPPQPAQAPTEPPPALPQPTLPPPPEEAVQPKKPPRRPSRAAAPAVPAKIPNQPPRLGEMLTPEQERQYNSAMDQSLQRAQANIARVSQRQLSKEQQGVVAQVESFIAQAQSTRKTNLTAAKSLAERADVLARELARTVK
jgi:hypothetical protein